MTIQLYHPNRDVLNRDDALDATDGMRNPEGAELFRRLMEAGGYELVAEIDTDDLDRAYLVTQNDFVKRVADGPVSWGTSPPEGVRPLGEDRLRRSSMMGDILVRDGIMHVVDTAGFAEIGPIPETTSAPKA